MKKNAIVTALLLATGLLAAACVADPEATAGAEDLGDEQEIVLVEDTADDTDSSEAAGASDSTVVIEKSGIASAVPPPCKETYTCESCASGKRTKQTYYAQQSPPICNSDGFCWRICSDLRTVYGSCGSCFQ